MFRAGCWLFLLLPQLVPPASCCRCCPSCSVSIRTLWPAPNLADVLGKATCGSAGAAATYGPTVAATELGLLDCSLLPLPVSLGTLQSPRAHGRASWPRPREHERVGRVAQSDDQDLLLMLLERQWKPRQKRRCCRKGGRPATASCLLASPTADARCKPAGLPQVGKPGSGCHALLLLPAGLCQCAHELVDVSSQHRGQAGAGGSLHDCYYCQQLLKRTRRLWREVERLLRRWLAEGLCSCTLFHTKRMRTAKQCKAGMAVTKQRRRRSPVCCRRGLVMRSS